MFLPFGLVFCIEMILMRHDLYFPNEKNGNCIKCTLSFEEKKEYHIKIA